MNLRKHHFNSIFIGVTLLALAACSGMSPSGGGAAGDVGGGPVGGGGDFSVGGGGVGGDGSGGGDLPGGGGGPGTGQGAPGSQQSGDNIGGGCVRRYQVKLKVLRNGSEEGCTGVVYYRRPVDSVTTEGVMAPSEEGDGNPKVTVTIGHPVTHSMACIAGQWQTAEPVFFRAVCSNYDVTAQAAWQQNGKLYSSNTYQGAPLMPEDYSPVLIELTMDLGNDGHLNHVPLEDAENAIY
jgi:hypothetical protein